jgi:endonuclease G
VAPALSGKRWLELPGSPGNQEYVQTTFDGQNRNFSYNYDKDMFTSLWTAYPLYTSTTGGSRKESWAKNPSIPEDQQINTWKGPYGVKYGSTTYARGHQIPDADRSDVAGMQAQTYYATNLVPQIQDGFNGGIWNNLETAVRAVVPQSDTLYVVTGVAFRKTNGSEKITSIQPQHDTKTCPVPNYFWKVLLKVKRSGNKVTAASTIGFWFEHKQYTDSYTNYAVSVDQIEQWTGFDFFVNVPDSYEGTAEDNSSWSVFQSF